MRVNEQTKVPQTKLLKRKKRKGLTNIEWVSNVCSNLDFISLMNNYSSIFPIIAKLYLS